MQLQKVTPDAKCVVAPECQPDIICEGAVDVQATSDCLTGCDCVTESTRETDGNIVPGRHAGLPALNLRHVKARVKKENPSLTRYQLSKAVTQYLKYWQFIKQSGGEGHPVPNPTVDLIWHAHILFTHAYEQDTKSYFGHFLHHSPRVGKSKKSQKGTCCSCSPHCNCGTAVTNN